MSRALGRYELLRPLARGGMAEVYLARRRAAGVEKWLVVKRIRAEHTKDVRFLDLFVREARLSMSLAHQNIVPVFDFGRIDDQVFLAMERVEGKDLGSSLARSSGTRIAPLLAAFIASECCQALDYAHKRKGPDGTALGIVHRDVTPRNVLLSWSGEVKLTDFGIAALAGETTSKLLGTPAYMAPEQARGEPLDARADLYALGLVLRETLTGSRARPGSDRESLIAAAKTGTVLPWPDGDIPDGIRQIVERATALEPRDRFADARAMLVELDDFMVAERAAHKSEAPTRRLAAWLEETWVGERDDREVDGDVEGDHLVSFLDDGALGVIGTGTERSLLATAAEAEPSPRAAEPHAPPAPETNSADRPTPSSTPVPSRRRPRAWIAASIVGIAVATAATVVLSREGTRVNDDVAATGAIATTTPRAAGSAIPGSVVPIENGSRAASGSAASGSGMDGSGIAGSDSSTITPSSSAGSGHGATGSATTGGDGSATTAPIRAGSGHAASSSTERPNGGHAAAGRPSGGRSSAPLGPGSAGSAASAPTALRKVTINATPWAYFTVDGDPTQHETVKTLQLASGKHTIHFSNPVLAVERTVTIEVPSERDLTYVERLQN